MRTIITTIVLSVTMLYTAQAQEWSKAVFHSGQWIIKKTVVDPFGTDKHPDTMIWVNGESLVNKNEYPNDAEPDLQFRLGSEDNNFKIQIDQPNKNPYQGSDDYVDNVTISFIFNGVKSSLLTVGGRQLKYEDGKGKTIWEVYDGVNERLEITRRCQKANYVHVKVEWTGADNSSRYNEVFKFDLNGFTTTLNAALKHSDLKLSADNANNNRTRNNTNSGNDDPFKG